MANILSDSNTNILEFVINHDSLLNLGRKSLKIDGPGWIELQVLYALNSAIVAVNIIVVSVRRSETDYREFLMGSLDVSSCWNQNRTGSFPFLWTKKF